MTNFPKKLKAYRLEREFLKMQFIIGKMENVSPKWKP